MIKELYQYLSPDCKDRFIFLTTQIIKNNIKFIENKKIKIINLLVDKIYYFKLLDCEKKKIKIYQRKIIQNNKSFFENNFELCNNIYKNPFISSQIKQYIITNIKYRYCYIDNNIIINIFTSNNDITNILTNILNVISFMKILFNNLFPQVFDLVIYLTPFKKILSNSGSLLLPDNINTGSTRPQIFIHIWRLEELQKVLIHEMVHYLNLDTNDNNNIISKEISKIINFETNTKILPNEAYTEAIAIILNCLFNSVIINTKKSFDYEKKDIIDIFNILLNYEIIWSQFQAAKIIKHHKCFNNYYELFDKNYSCKFRQKTSVFSYYIIKGVIISKINEFIELLEKINSDKYYFIKFHNSEDNLNKLTDFIKKTLNDDYCNNKISFFMNIFDKYKNNLKYIDIINTTRMSIIDLYT